MPLLLRVLSEVHGPEYNALKAKTMECAGLIGWYILTSSRYRFSHKPVAIAVGRETFIPDAPNFCEQLIRIQSEYASFRPGEGD